MSGEWSSIEKVSIAVSSGILLVAFVFWAIQIQSVIELLRLAYS